MINYDQTIKLMNFHELGTVFSVSFFFFFLPFDDECKKKKKLILKRVSHTQTYQATHNKMTNMPEKCVNLSA